MTKEEIEKAVEAYLNDETPQEPKQPDNPHRNNPLGFGGAFHINPTRKELTMEIIGYISQSVIETLHLSLRPNTPVFIGESNIEHIKNRHPYEYNKYYKDIGAIINSPDYVGINPKDGSLLFVKLYKVHGEYIRVAVKITSGGKCFAKTLHALSTCNAERYLEKGTLKRLDTT